MKYANGKEARVGDTVIGRDNGGNVVSGVVVNAHRDDQHLRISSTPILVRADHAIDVLDVAADLDKMIAAKTPKPSPPAPKAKSKGPSE